MSRKAFLVWRVAGAVVGVATWPFVLPLGVAGIPLSRWWSYAGWSGVLGWVTWATIGGLVEASLGGGASAVVTFLVALAASSVSFFVALVLKIPVFDEPWCLLEPALLTIPVAFGAAAIRICALSVVRDIRRRRPPSRDRSYRPGLLLSFPMLVLAFLLMGWLVKVFYGDIAHERPNSQGSASTR
jgi:hypothetical protein